MKHKTILDVSLIFSKTGYIFFCHFLSFPKVPVKNLLKLREWFFWFKSTCSTSSLRIIYLHFLISWRQLHGKKKAILIAKYDNLSSLYLRQSHFMYMFMETLPVEDTWINHFFPTLKNEKYLNIAINKITELPLRYWIWRVWYFANFTSLSEIRKILYPQSLLTFGNLSG